MRSTPGSPLPEPVRFTCAGKPPRASTHWRISSRLVVVTEEEELLFEEERFAVEAVLRLAPVLRFAVDALLRFALLAFALVPRFAEDFDALFFDDDAAARFVDDDAFFALLAFFELDLLPPALFCELAFFELDVLAPDFFVLDFFAPDFDAVFFDEDFDAEARFAELPPFAELACFFELDPRFFDDDARRAVVRATNLLKRFPSSSDSSSARRSRSNHSKNSSHSTSSSVFSPLKPGKSMRRMPGSLREPVRFTRAGCPPRDSTHWRISS
jgi:hypothetical protein